MASFPALTCALALLGAPDTVLLDFGADWCGPCRQMEPTVKRLAASGYPVRQVNIDREQQLAAQYRVDGVPCFVMLVGGREVDRVVGATSYERLEQMFRQASSPSASSQAVTNPPSAKGRLAKIAPQRKQDVEARLLAASVRIRIDDGDGNSVGSGTIIDSRAGEALILTCGHVFRDSQGKGQVTVDLFGPGAPRGLPATVVDFDLKADIGLISIRPGVPVTAAPLAGADYRPQTGEPVFTVGCDHGADATLERTRIKGLNKFLGPANLQVDGQPVQGRSGGGLFSLDGRVIGVCNAADPADNEGLFAALSNVYSELERLGLADLLTKSEAPPAMAATMASSAATHDSTAASDSQTALTPDQLQALASIPSTAAGAEVICIVRPLSDPRAQSEIIVLDRASPKLLEQLAAERARQDQRRLTSWTEPADAAGWRPAQRTASK